MADAAAGASAGAADGLDGPFAALRPDAAPLEVAVLSSVEEVPRAYLVGGEVGYNACAWCSPTTVRAISVGCRASAVGPPTARSCFASAAARFD